MKRFAFLMAVLVASQARADMDSCYRATCRIFTGQGYGTGCVYMQDEQNYYVLTNAHVVGTQTGRKVQCVFNDRGHERPIMGQTAWGTMTNGENTDQAVVSIPLASFTDFQPAIVPIAPKNLRLRNGQEVLSVGCPEGHWNSLWRGHIIEVGALKMSFLPAPAQGRSGSAIFDGTGTYIVGLLTWGDATGLAQTLENLYVGMFGETLDQAVPKQFAPCPNGNCPQPQIIRPRRPQPQQRPPGGNGGTYNPFPKQPNLPQTIPVAPKPKQPVAPSPDSPDPQPPTSPVTPPATAPVKGCECGTHTDCKCENDKMFATLIERIKAMESKLDNAATTAGPQGPAGKDGKDAEPVDYEKLAALVVSKLPKPNVTEPEQSRPKPEPYYFEIKPRK